MIFRKATSRQPVLAQTMGTGGTRFSIDNDQASDAALVKRYGLWMYRCININASVAASIPLRLFTIDTSGVIEKHMGGRKPDQRTKSMLKHRMSWKPGQVATKRMQGNMDDLVEIDNHDLLQLLDNVNPWQEGFSYRDLLFKDLDIYGRHFTHLVGPKGAPPDELWRMQPEATKVLKHPADFIAGYEYGRGTDKVVFPPEDVIWIRIPDPADPWGSRGPMAASLEKIDASIYLAKFQKWMFEHGGSPDWLLMSKKGMSEQQRKDFNKSWRAAFARLWHRAKTVLIVSGDAELKALNQSPRELEYSQSDTNARDTVCGMFGVPVAFVMTDKIAANSREAMNQFKLLNIWPKVTRVEDKLNQQLVPMWSDRMFLVHDNPIEEDRAIKLRERQSKLGAGGTINEARADDGLEALDDETADVPMVATGLVRLDSLGLAPVDPDAEQVEGGEELPDITGDLQTTEATVLNGAQITAATAIVQAVADGVLPIESARGQLVVFYNLSTEQANAILAGVEGFEPAAPEPAPTVPPPPPAAAPEPEPEDEAKDWHDIKCGCTHAHHKAASDPYQNEPFERDMQAVLAKLANGVAADVDGAKGATVLTKEAPNIDPADFIDYPEWAAEIAAVAEKHIGFAVAKAGEAAIAELPGTSPISFDLANTRARRYVEDQSNKVGGKAAETWGDEIRNVIATGIDEGKSSQEIARELREFSIDKSPLNAERISRTETAFASTAGRIEGWEQSGVVAGKQYRLSPDPCPICVAVAEQYEGVVVPLGNDLYPLGSSLEYTDERGKQQTAVFNYTGLAGPPIHPHCRCQLIPVISEETPE